MLLTETKWGLETEGQETHKKKMMKDHKKNEEMQC